jgi:hypothetical protein
MEPDVRTLLEAAGATSSPPHQRWVSWRFAVLAIASAAILSYLVALEIGHFVHTSQPMSKDAQASSTTVLRVDAEHLSLGEVWESYAFNWSLPIENVSDQDVSITGFGVPCGCVAIEPRTLTIPPRKIAHISLSIDLTKQVKQEEDNPDTGVRAFSITIRPVLQVATSLFQDAWTIRGRVRRAITVEPEVLDFGEVSEEGPFVPRTAWVRPRCSVSNLTATANSNQSVIVSCHHEDRGQFKVQVTPKGPLSPGKFSSHILLCAIHEDGRALPPVRLYFTGVCQEDIQLVPQSLLFGFRNIGKTAEDVVLIQSLTGQRFRVLAAESDSSDLTITPVQAASKEGGVAFRIAQTLGTPGRREASVIFTIERENNAILKRKLDVITESRQSK